ncbi:hypothetical protein OEZ85_002779 [Tetradesmus obliquus]|uniref:AAA+ ATPase domain-containing protein n=1 Tax=Tetradesmus obliquus TaxID=3088 RepID=A0ABY8U0T2_TETOB|nr:hypothetical protein OEZ85_002779 [Tetradesmus obliquus]
MLQKRHVASDLKAWEEQQRQQAQQEIQQMEADAALQAEEAAAEAAMQQQEEARLAAQLAAKQSSLQQLQQQADAQLQDIANKKQRVAAATQEKQGKVEAAARMKGSQQITVARWRAALSQLASQGALGLPSFQAMLQQAAAGGAEAAADSLDVVFDVAQLGGLLLEYATAGQVAAAPALPSSAARGLSLMAEQKWRAEGSSSKALKELVKLTGLDPVKKEMFNLADQVALDKQRGRSPNSRNFNVRFYGNPGTGKTTVARLYAQLLEELGVLPQAAVEETSGAALVAGGLNEIKAKLTKLEKGGVLFIDEAYQLDPAKNPMGAQVLDYLLPEMENKQGSLVVVLAGYQKPMEEKVMAHNEGLPSRFPLLFKFPDYSDEQLLQIFTGQLEAQEPRFQLEDTKHARIAARRLGRQRDSGTSGFGNARAVRNLLEAAISRQSARVLEEQRAGLAPDLLLLKRDDLLGPKELDVTGSKPLQQLKGLRGLEKVKQSVGTLLGLLRTNAELEEQERPLKEVCLNRVFMGNPGTGKTTVASMYGRILKDLGLLSKGDVLVKVPADFLGSVLGESEKKTMAILEEARGCVLVIDEAYGLHSGSKSRDPYKEAVIDTIVAKVQGVPGDDRCVLLLGYPDQMEAMMREANPGLARRFQLAQAWQFEDYNKEDLLAITREAARKKYGWELDWPVLQAALNSLEQEKRRPNFGNAGAVNNLLSTAAMRMEARTAHLPTAQRAAAAPAPEDFMSEADAAAAAARAAGKAGAASEAVFSDLIGCQSVLAKLKEWQATITASQALGKDPLDSFELNFTFVGAPGTGKTTVARRVGLLFQQLGLLGTDQVVECSAGDFVTGYANQASGKTREMFEKALGGVLFIDEAYRLNPKHGGPYMSEVLDEICQILTDKQFMGKMVVVLAGYEQQIEELLAVNPGLKSRFSERLVFPDFSVADAVQLLLLSLTGKQYGLQLAPEALHQLPGLMQQLMDAPGWSNGRDVGTWAKRIFRTYSLRLAQGGNDPSALNTAMVFG